MKFLSLFFVLGLALFGNSKLHVCYTKKSISESTGNVAYVGCKRYHDSCDSNGKLHFGKYPSSSKASSALTRCIDSSPKFVDSGHKNTSTDGQVYNLDPNGDGFLSLRTKPKGREIGKLYNGNKVKILSERGKWYKVRTSSGLVGWSHGGWIKLTNIIKKTQKRNNTYLESSYINSNISENDLMIKIGINTKPSKVGVQDNHLLGFNLALTNTKNSINLQYDIYPKYQKKFKLNEYIIKLEAKISYEEKTAMGWFPIFEKKTIYEYITIKLSKNNLYHAKGKKLLKRINTYIQGMGLTITKSDFKTKIKLISIKGK